MKKNVKIVSLILALIMIAAVFSACGQKENEEKEDPKDTVVDTKDGETTGDQTEETTKVPDVGVIDWDGREYRILGKDHAQYDIFTSFEVWRQEIPEDVVGKAIWKRNQDMLENYGIDVVGYLKQDCNSLAATTLESGEDIYDLMILSPEAFNPFAMKGQLYDIYTLDFVNTDHDAWMPYPNEQLTMGGRLYYTTNKFLIQDKNRYWGMYYNRDMANELNLGHFEDFVFEGTWTVDKVIELAKKGTYELDGQQGLGKRDNWGVCCYEYYNFVQIGFGVGFRFTEKGPDGYPVLIGASEDIMSRLDEMFRLTADTSIVWNDERYGDMSTTDSSVHMFYAERALMMIGSLSTLQEIGAMVDFKYGVLPNPKYNKNQDLYYTIPNLVNGSLFGVPSTAADSEFVGYALELISEKSIDTSYRAFIEVNSKLQKVYDEDSAKCLELIYDGVVYDIAFVSNIGNIGNIFWRNVAGSTTNNYQRVYQRNQSAVETSIDNIRKAYAELE